MTTGFFVSDLHGSRSRCDALFAAIRAERPDAVFLGGDLLPGGFGGLGEPSDPGEDFLEDVLAGGFERLRGEMRERYPRVFLILGNDDPGVEETRVLDGEARGTWEYAHGRRIGWGPYDVYGYSFVPPTPFLLKDWERYDVSRYVDPGCTPPDQGWHTTVVPEGTWQRATIREDLARLVGERSLDSAVLLVHSPPHRTRLDRAALDGRTVDHAPVDVHVGSIALRRFIEERQPLVTLHGHVHESARLTGSWRDRIGRTHLFSAAHDGPELALVRFDPERPGQATRELLHGGRPDSDHR